VRPWHVALAWPADRLPGDAAAKFIVATEEACRAAGLAAAA
jgi:hypothetical protein